MASRRPGQALVMFALLMTVLLGMLALVVDLGMGMVQIRALQNAADAGAMNGARVMAGTVATDASNNVIYVSLANQTVHDRVLDFVTPNRLVSAATFTYSTAVEFLNCSSGSLGFTAASDAALVTSLGGTRLASATTTVPNNACSLRVHTRVSFPSFFAAIVGVDNQTVGARATARIAPTSPPTTISGVWPIGRWTYNDPGCTYQVGALCTFWDSSPPPGGDFKEAIDMSRRSELSGRTLDQFWVDYDHRWPGNNGKTVDLPEWLRHGWQGKAFVDESDSRCQTANLACPNSKFEIYGGNTGNNMSEMMTAYINDPAHLEGTDPVRGNYATIGVFFWRYAEQEPFTGNVGTLWGNTANPLAENPNSIRRIILQKVRRFRFYTSTVSTSSVRGYYVSFFNDTQPLNGRPNSIANTVVLTE
jgi:Flp pilus assembly protein TadG